MRDLQSIIRSAFLLWLFFVGMCLARPALAIEKYAAVPLPDAGLGSRALALTDFGPSGSINVGSMAIVGAQKNSVGMDVAMFWVVDNEPLVVDPNNPNIVYAIALPTPPGMSSVATGIAFLEGNPDKPIIVGSFIDNITFDRVAVLWRRDPSSGQFTNTILDDEASQANGLTVPPIDLNLLGLVVGKYRLPNGDWHACLWRVSANGDVARTDLGTLGGANSEARAISYAGGDGNDVVLVAGSAENSNGRTLAACWAVRLTGGAGLDWFLRALPTPSGAESGALALIGGSSNNVWWATGFISAPNGRTSACLWINQGDNPSEFVSELHQGVLGQPGYPVVLTSIANGLVGHAGMDILIAGTARNSDGVKRGVAALPFNGIFDDPFFFDALASRDIVLDWNAVALEAVAPGGAIAGEALYAGSTTPQATLFVPTNVEGPQQYSLLVGTYSYHVGPDIHSLWQRDGNALHIRPRVERGVQSIMAEWTSTRYSGMSSRAPQQLTLVGRARPRNANTDSDVTLTLQLYDTSAEAWVEVASRILASDEFFNGLMIEIPDPERFAVSAGEPLRWRLGLLGEGWRACEIDLMEMNTMSVAP